MALKERKPQEEMLQPINGYQLEAVEVKVDDMNQKLDTILKQTNGLVTPAQLEDAKTSLKLHIKEEIKKIHLIYGPLKNKINALNATLATAVILQLIYILFNLFGGK